MEMVVTAAACSPRAQTDSAIAPDAAPTTAEPAAPAPRRTRRALDELSPQERAAREAMIAKHLPLVRYVANAMARHAGQSVLLDYDDLLSYGTEGLIAAVDTFEEERGLKFSTWAVMHIRTTIQDALRTLDPLPRSLRAKGKEIDRVAAALAHASGRWPDLPEIAAALGQPLDQLRRTLQDLGHTLVSLEQADDGHNGASTSGDDNGFSLLNLLADEDPEGDPAERLDRRELSRLLRDAIAALPPREEVLIDAHYRRGQSMREVARLLGISESRVSQLHARAIRLLREYLEHALAVDPAASPRRPRRAIARPLAPRRPARAPRAA
jgi:RNA polymerase sigma factor for flagellar operon FliA